jgi:hypothetical protein
MAVPQSIRSWPSSRRPFSSGGESPWPPRLKGGSADDTVWMSAKQFLAFDGI